jgi:hypothetical protein
VVDGEQQGQGEVLERVHAVAAQVELKARFESCSSDFNFKS